MGFLFDYPDVYRRAVDFSEEVFKLTAEWPNGRSALAEEFRRAAMSISSNIAEGNGLWHTKARKNYFVLSRGSVFECEPFLELCRQRNWIADDYSKHLKEEAEILTRMLGALIDGPANRRPHRSAGH